MSASACGYDGSFCINDFQCCDKLVCGVSMRNSFSVSDDSFRAIGVDMPGSLASDPDTSGAKLAVEETGDFDWSNVCC
jgi:hypothetical protein